MKNCWRRCLYFLVICAVAIADAGAQQIDAASHKSIVAALQLHMQDHPSVFPMESLAGGVQSVAEGLQAAYFGFGERRFSDRTDFHLSIDLAYSPVETGEVKTMDGVSWKVRAPATYLKKIYAIQDGLLVSAAKNSTGIKIILRHTLENPYYDDEGRAYHDYYTSYRHVDGRSLDYLATLAKQVLHSETATLEDLVGKHVFKAGDVIAFVGFDPNTKVGYPRAHLDFSLHVFADANKGGNIRRYSINPLLLFPVFDYANPRTYQTGESGLPAYRFAVEPDSIVAPAADRDGAFRIAVEAGGLSAGGVYIPTGYFALNSVRLDVFNGGVALAAHTLDRDRRLGYDPSSYEKLDNPDTSRPHFAAPLDEQGNVYRMGVVLPKSWFEEIGYDWTKSGSVVITIASVWDDSLGEHNMTFEISLLGPT